MKGKNRIILLCAALFALTVIGGLLHTSPALAWDTWPTATNNDPNHTWTVVFDQAMNTETINGDNIYVSNDIAGSSRVSGVSVSASDNTHALVAPPTGGWSTDTNYYLIITQKVLTQAGMPLKDEVRMPFRIVVETRETPVIDVINNGTNIIVIVNGKQLSFDQPPYIANGSTMVPFRAIAEALGAEVEWDPAVQKITIMGDKTVELTVNSTIARVNGASVTLDNPAVISGGRTMVPLRFVGEALGAKVNYTSLVKYESDDRYGNTVGNITNFGNVCKKGEWLYFTNTTDDYKLYKSRSDGSGWTKLCDDNANNINVIGDWIYYCGNNDLYKIRTDGSSRTKLFEDWPTDINVVGDWIYFINFDDNKGLYKIKTDGSALTKITDESCYYMNVVGEWIYYQNQNDGYKLYKIRTDGSGKTKLNDDKSACLNVIDEWVYYCCVKENYGISGQLYRIRTDGSSKTELSKEKVGYINVSGDWIYYSNFGDSGKLYKMLKDGSNQTRVNSDNNSSLINVADDWVYYRTKIGAGYVPVYRIHTDGSDREVFN